MIRFMMYASVIVAHILAFTLAVEVVKLWHHVGYQNLPWTHQTYSVLYVGWYVYWWLTDECVKV